MRRRVAHRGELLCLYLSHKIAFHLVQVALGDRLHGVAIFAVYALAALALGSALHVAVERPFLRLRERRAMRRALPVAA